MSFFSEVAKRVGLSELNLSAGYNVINYNGETVYIEGVKQLLKVEQGEISVLLKGATLFLRGEDLNISELSDTVIVRGDIATLEFVKSKAKGGRNENPKKN